MEDSSGVPARLVEANNKREQIQTERQNPEKRYDGHILTDQVRRGQKHNGSARRQAQPKQMASGAGLALNGVSLHSLTSQERSDRLRRSAGFSQAQSAIAADHGKDNKPCRPDAGLGPKGKPGLHEKGIGKQAQQRSQIGERVQTIRR